MEAKGLVYFKARYTWGLMIILEPFLQSLSWDKNPEAEDVASYHSLLRTKHMCMKFSSSVGDLSKH